MAVRSNYIKNLMEGTNSLEEKYQKVVAESMQNIIGESTKEEVRKLLKESEDEDYYEEEEVSDDTANADEVNGTNVTDATDDEDDDYADNIEDFESTPEDDSNDDFEDGLWDDLEQCKSADGEYDCRGMEDGKLIKVLKAMGPEDGIRVMSNEDGTVELEVNGDLIDGTVDFIIEVDDECPVEESKHSNTGYTTDYQKVSAMSISDNHETANPKTTYSMDGGVPTGTEKPWAGKGNSKPYGAVNEEDEMEFEIESGDDGENVNEVASTTENNPTVRGTGMTHANTNSKGKIFRSSSEGGTRLKGTGENSYSGSATNESVKRFKKEMNKIYTENKDMKSLIPQLQKKLMESMVINQSMGYIVRLLNENATTVDEKKQISDRFSKVNTLAEGKQLYNTISEELKRTNKRTDMKGVINGQLAEGKQTKQNLVETTMYKSAKVNETLDFMKRLNSIK